MGRFLPMKLAALLLLLLQTPKPLDPTVATCQELVFTSRDEVDELMLQMRQFASDKRPSSGTPVGTTGPVQVIRGNRIENLMFEKPEVEAPVIEGAPQKEAEAPANKSDSPQ